jgi:hypothetical protein
MYVSGMSCTSSNEGKTAARTHLYRRMMAAVQQRNRVGKS